MAQVVGVTPAELREAGRDDAADELELLERPKEHPTPTPTGGHAPPLEAVTAIMASLSPEAQEEVIRRLGYMTPTQAPKGGALEHQHRRAG
ncbi:hypothetical protein ABT358_02035 [Streptomyces sp. NPDC000341]|uniref:hypothetical protein n=1 Tax=Streptomyces sp. NPDC000341 TaxID=3156645 RepID=UPI00331F4802